jgi:exosortase
MPAPSQTTTTQPPHTDLDLQSLLSRGRLLIAAVLAISLAFLPVLFRYFSQLWAREHYQFFPFAIAVMLGFAVVRTDPAPRFEGKSVRWSLRGIFLAIALSLLAVAALRSPSPLTYYAAFAILVTLLLDFFVEQNSGRSLTYLVIPFLLTIRPPRNIDERMMAKLQALTSSIASQFLNTLKMDHILDGNTLIPMEGPALGVAEACSGVQSLFTLMFIASVIGVYHRYPMLRILLLTGSAVFWALLMNVTRVLSIAVAQIKFQTDLTTGWQHDAVGYAAMLLAIPFLLSTDRLLQFFFGPIPDDPRKHAQINVLVLGWNWLLATSSDVLDTPAEIAERLRRLPEWSALQSGRRRILASLAALVLLAALPSWRLLLTASGQEQPPTAPVTAQTTPPERTL